MESQSFGSERGRRFGKPGRGVSDHKCLSEQRVIRRIARQLRKDIIEVAAALPRCEQNEFFIEIGNSIISQIRSVLMCKQALRCDTGNKRRDIVFRRTRADLCLETTAVMSLYLRG